MEFLKRLEDAMDRFLSVGIAPSRAYLEAWREVLREGIAEWEREKEGVPTVKQVSIGGNCVQSVIITGENNGKD